MLTSILVFALADLLAVLLASTGMLFLILHLLLNSSSSVKAKGSENRLVTIVQGIGAQAGRVNNLSGNSTTNAGLPDGTIGGHTDTAGLANGTIGGSTGQINTGGGTAHTHGSGSLAVNNGQHQHGASATNGNLAVNNGVHSHNLPTV